jgi:transcriptional regulator with XRE-family HTH domain
MRNRDRSARLTGRHSSVEAMVRATSEDKTFADEFEQKMARRRVIHHLISLRGVKGLSQMDIAAKMGCTQSRISKMEASDDDDLSLGDLRKYASAIGLGTEIGFMTRGSKIVDRVKVHAFQIETLIHRLAGLAEHDPAIAKGVSSFFGEAAFNLLVILQEAADKLPKSKKALEEESLDLEVYGPNEEGIAIEAKGAKTLPEEVVSA